jgi:predicted nucleic acid-binding protein
MYLLDTNELSHLVRQPQGRALRVMQKSARTWC